MSTITYSFKEVCEKTQYKPSVIRYYEKEFSLNIPRDLNGRRYFTTKEIERLLYIKQLQQEGYSNSQIKKIWDDKKILCFEEVAVTNTPETISKVQTDTLYYNNNDIKSLLEDNFIEIKSNINELAQVVSGKERDLLISENMKLKMEVKQKSYEIMELKEKLRYEKEKSRGLFTKLFKKTN